MCVHSHIVHSLFIDTSMNLKLSDRPLKKKLIKPLMWWTTHPAARTRCCSGSQVPCHYFSLIGTIWACFLNIKEHTAEKKMADFALPSSPSLIFTTQSCNFSRLMSPFVSHKFPVIVLQLHHKRSIWTKLVYFLYAWSVRAWTLYGSKKPFLQHHTSVYNKYSCSAIITSLLLSVY